MTPYYDNGLVTELVVADLFCGAGGSSTGAERAVREMGSKMELVCVNHWPIAIETHKKNHPSARHYVEDVATVDPERIVPEGRLDLLMASPECRYYSRARGGKPIQDQGRMHPWAVQRWLTSLDVRCVLIENVPEFVSWGPLTDDGKPDKNKTGVYFQAWIKSFWELGYSVDWKYLNSADFGDATTRTRFFLQARKDGVPIRWPERTHTQDGALELFDGPKRWRGAREIIDWDNQGRSLLDDKRYIKKPLSIKTRKRIARGLERFGGPLAPLYIRLLGLEAEVIAPDGDASPFTMGEPIIWANRNNNVARSADEPIPPATTAPGGGIYVVQPQARPFVMGKQGSPSYRDMGQPVPTVTTQGSMVLVEPTAEPFILGQHSGSTPRSTENPIPTVVSDGAIALVQPVVIQYYRTSGGSDVDQPLPTVTTKARLAIASPCLVEVNHSDDGTGKREKSVDVPLGTVTTHRTTALVEPFIVPQFGEAPGQAARIHEIGEPLPSVTSHGAGALVQPVVENIQAEVDPQRLVFIDGHPYLLDIRFRMLTNLELARAMGFTNEEATYEFVGNIGEVTKQIGNAVAVNTAAALVTAILGSH